jgi:hypothetical protein
MSNMDRAFRSLIRRRLDNPKQDCEQEAKGKQTHNVMHDPWPPHTSIKVN